MTIFTAIYIFLFMVVVIGACVAWIEDPDRNGKICARVLFLSPVFPVILVWGYVAMWKKAEWGEFFSSLKEYVINFKAR